MSGASGSEPVAPSGPQPDEPAGVAAEPDDLHPETPDVLALRRRVLLVGLLTAFLFFALAYVLTALDAAGWAFPVLVAVLYVAVVRPLMRPVREATALRRRLAQRAYLEQKEGRS